LAGQTSFFEDESELSHTADEAMGNYQFLQAKVEEKRDRKEQRELMTVDIHSVCTAESRSLGPELVVHTYWERLGFDALLNACGLTLTEQSLAKAVIIARLIAPSSDLATWNWLRNQTSLLELLPVNLSEIGKDAIYEIADKLLIHKTKLETALIQREKKLFPSETTLFLYDLTNTYFEGSCTNNSLAKRGKSKEKRSDCPLVTMALVVDERGFPLHSQIYGGNQSEPQTLSDILNRLYEQDEPDLFEQVRPTIVMDRGIATKDNMLLLKKKEYPYIVVERRAVENDYVAEFTETKAFFQRVDNKQGTDLSQEVTVSEAVYAKKIPWEDGCRILCVSEGRVAKETAMDTLKEARFIHDLTRLQTSVAKGNVILEMKVGERVGRLKERYPSIAGHYEIAFELNVDSKKVTAVTWTKKSTRSERSTLTGCYVIETSHKELSAEEVWRLYTTLAQVEYAFRSLKTDLGVRPVYHQLAERTRGHLFISVLAYHLLICIEHQLREKKDHRKWATLRNQLSTHQRSTVIITDEHDQIHHVRVSGRPESIHQEIYKLLDVKDTLKKKHQQISSKVVVPE
jgi:transposase